MGKLRQEIEEVVKCWRRMEQDHEAAEEDLAKRVEDWKTQERQMAEEGAPEESVFPWTLREEKWSNRERDYKEQVLNLLQKVEKSLRSGIRTRFPDLNTLLQKFEERKKHLASRLTQRREKESWYTARERLLGSSKEVLEMKRMCKDLFAKIKEDTDAPEGDLPQDKERVDVSEEEDVPTLRRMFLKQLLENENLRKEKIELLKKCETMERTIDGLQEKCFNQEERISFFQCDRQMLKSYADHLVDEGKKKDAALIKMEKVKKNNEQLQHKLKVQEESTQLHYATKAIHTYREWMDDKRELQYKIYKGAEEHYDALKQLHGKIKLCERQEKEIKELQGKIQKRDERIHEQREELENTRNELEVIVREIETGNKLTSSSEKLQEEETGAVEQDQTSQSNSPSPPAAPSPPEGTEKKGRRRWSLWHFLCCCRNNDD